MQRKFFLILILLLIIANMSAACNEGQIDINSASASELDRLSGIGSVKANAIIDSRPFAILEDLINVYGIGEVTLGKIKDQGLACVEEEEENSNQVETATETSEDKIDKVSENDSDKEIEFVNKSEMSENAPVEEKRETILLNPKDIKTETNNEIKRGKGNSWLYLVLFCFLLGLLFTIKNKLKRKNEFR